MTGLIFSLHSSVTCVRVFSVHCIDYPLVKDMNKAYSATSTNKTTSLNGLKFVSLNINGIRGKKLELLAFLDHHKPEIVDI